MIRNEKIKKMNPKDNKEPKMISHHTWISVVLIHFITLFKNPPHILVSDKLFHFLKTNCSSDFIP